MKYVALIVFLCAFVKNAQSMTTSEAPCDAERKQETALQRDQHSVVSASDIPIAPPEMTLFKLAPQTAPAQLIERSLSVDRHAVELVPLRDTTLFRDNHIEDSAQLRGVEQDQHIWAWIDPGTGDAAIYPSLRHLNPIRPETVGALSEHAQQILKSNDLIEHDATQSCMDVALLLKGGTISRQENGQGAWIRPPASYLAYFLVRRYVGPYRVIGPGSRAFIALDEQNRVSALLKVWQSATVSSVKLHPSFTTDEIVQKISSQLQLFATAGKLIVEGVDIVYYDGNGKFLQPVYRFTFRIQHPSTPLEPAVTDESFVGYVPYTDGIETLPLLGNASGIRPSEVECKKAERPVSGGGATVPISIGRYVIRDAEDEADTYHSWVANSAAFMTSLSSSVLGMQFKDSQYCWARPSLFTTDKNRFINAMHVSLVEADGTWWYFRTRQCSKSSGCDGVHLDKDITGLGYGAAAKGALAFWIIHSCEVIPSPDDTAAWATAWWSVFGGIRSVVGYRTKIDISDGAEFSYPTSLGKLAPVASSWLGDVIALNDYANHPTAVGPDRKNHSMGKTRDYQCLWP